MTLFFVVLILLPFVALVPLYYGYRHRHHLGTRPIKIWAVIFVVAMLVDPISQAIILEPLDNRRGAAMAKRAHAAGIIGMDHDQVRALLGEPSRVQYFSGYEPTWEYKQVPGYWSGSHFQVFFKSGVVYSVEPNDD